MQERIQQTSEKGQSSGLKSHVPEEPGSSGWLELQRGGERASSRRVREALNSWLVRGKKKLNMTGEDWKN